MAMHAAIAAKAIKMQRTPMLFAVFYRAKKRRVGKEIPVFNGFCDARKLLVDHAPCTNVQVPYLGVAHLPRWEANRSS